MIVAGVITAERLKEAQNIDIEWLNETVVENDGTKILCLTNNEVCRALVRLSSQQIQEQLYGTNPYEETEVDHWLTFCIGPLSIKKEFSSAVEYMNKHLAPVTYLVAKRLTLADYVVFSTLYGEFLTLNFCGVVGNIVVF